MRYSGSTSSRASSTIRLVSPAPRSGSRPSAGKPTTRTRTPPGRCLPRPCGHPLGRGARSRDQPDDARERDATLSIRPLCPPLEGVVHRAGLAVGGRDVDPVTRSSRGPIAVRGGRVERAAAHKGGRSGPTSTRPLIDPGGHRYRKSFPPAGESPNGKGPRMRGQPPTKSRRLFWPGSVSPGVPSVPEVPGSPGS